MTSEVPCSDRAVHAPSSSSRPRLGRALPLSAALSTSDGVRVLYTSATSLEKMESLVHAAELMLQNRTKFGSLLV